MDKNQIKKQHVVKLEEIRMVMGEFDKLEPKSSRAQEYNYMERKPDELYESEDKFYKVFNASPVTMSISSLKDERYIDANEGFCRAIGYRHEELLGKTAFDIGFWVYPDEGELIKNKLIEKEPVRDMEIRFCGKSKEQRLGLFSAEILDIDGEECILGILTDITERRKMETEISRLDRLNLVGEMAISIGHEIRNPITTVRGFLQMFEGRYSKEKETLQLMIEEIDRANAIITEFLSLAKNKLVELKPNNLNFILKNVLPLLQANAIIQNKTIKVEMENIPEMLMDEKEIAQLIFNLVNNGLEAMTAGGIVTIRTFVEKEAVVLAVKDQGAGIDLELMDKLGIPFFSTKDQGTGLGLAVCYGIADRHHASIDIDTGPKGTNFFVRFTNKQFYLL